jgi:saccharopine dehydrogenase-like NADP-dependent oxidoreductase
MRKPCIAVLGTGSIGKRIIDDLLETFDGSVVAIGHSRRSSLKELRKSSKLILRTADVLDSSSLLKVLQGVDVVIHAVHHEFNVAVMNACLKTKTHYVDLGGLYYYTKTQLKLHAKFKQAQLIAVIGMGAAPGISNILAKYGSRDFDRVTDIEIRIGVADQSTYRHESPLSAPYSIQTLLEECSWKAAVFRNGRITFREPFSGRERYKFREPVGWQKPQFTIHSELATLPKTLRARNVFFKIAFPDSFVKKIMTLRSIGLLEEKRLPVATAILKKLPPSIPERIEQFEIIQVILRGMRRKKKSSIRVEAHVPTSGETIDKDTAAPASIVAQMMLRREWAERGVFAPEEIVPEELFFRELSHRGIWIYRNSRKIS